MKVTPREVYESIYGHHKYFYIAIDRLSEDKASRLANKVAVKNTWINYNELKEKNNEKSK